MGSDALEEEIELKNMSRAPFWVYEQTVRSSEYFILEQDWICALAQKT
jgi:hypothetical protein